MHKTLGYLAMFAAGAAIGSCATWYVLKEKYAQIAQEEIESVKETFKNTFTPSNNDISEEETVKKETSDYKSVARSYDYSKYTNAEPKVKSNMEDEPYVISPDEFGELDDYECITLFYYLDEVLADDRNEIVDNANDMVGSDFAEHFGEYEDDSVFIRNDSRKCDYEILLDGRKFSEVAD